MPPGATISSSRAGPSGAQNRCGRPRGQEDETARRRVKDVAAAADGQLAVQDVEALVFALMDMRWRPGLDAGLKDAQYSARRPARRLKPWTARQAGPSRDHIARQELSHGIRDQPAQAGTGRRFVTAAESARI